MGLLSASTSISRFRVREDIRPDYKEHYPLQIRRYSFRELDENSMEERSMGWVNLMDILDNKFFGEEFFKENIITLSMRIDARKVPPKALKHYCMQAEAEQKARLNKNFLAKAERKEIKERIYLKLLKRVIPQTSVHDMMWNIKKREVIFSSLNKSICEEFAGLFKKTFELSLIALFPYTMAEAHLTGDQLAVLGNTQPYSFY